MNQILLTNNQNIKKKSSGNYNGNDSSGDMKKIIIFFAITILVFAIAIIGLYAYKMSKTDKKEAIAKPELIIEQIEKQVKIIATAEAGINKIVYTWNDEQPTEVEMNGRTKHEEALEIPEGQNTLKVIVTDKNDDKIESSKEFYIEETKKPTIQLDETIGNGKVKITATDENSSIKYITYRWNDEEETTVEAEENQTTLEVTIDVKRGKNTLTVIAVNEFAKTETVEKIFNGVNNPIIEVTREGNVIYMKVTHDIGFEKIEFNINGTEYIYDKDFYKYDGERKEVSYKYNLKQGENKVIIKAISKEETEATYKGKCEYIAE